VIWVPVAVGALLLLFGRRLYWLFVGAIGFAVGMSVASRALERESETTRLVLAIVVGLVGVILALFLQRVAIALAGFLAGAWLAASLWNALADHPSSLPWLAALAGGILGALLSATLFDWVLIVISSLAGAALVAEYLPVARDAQGVVIAVLALVGIVVQGSARGTRATPAPERS
jgi:hypothetical protein